MTDEATPLVSLVIPVYNQRLPFLRDAVESALRQTYANLEVVVSNNHSNAEVTTYLDSLSDPRLRLVKPAEFLPMVAHFQFAADQARGDYVSFLCSDDWLYADFVAGIVPHLVAHPSVVVGYGEIECVDHRDLNAIKYFYNRRKTGFRTAAQSLNELIRARPFMAWIPGGIFRRSAYAQVCSILSGEFTYAFDLALLFRLHELGDVFYVDKPLGKFRFWTVKDGKVASDRFQEFIADTGKLCALIEQSPKLMSCLTNGPADMQTWRQYQAGRWLLGLLVGYLAGDVGADKCRAGIRAVAEHISPLSTPARLLRWAVGRPQSLVLRPSLRGMHRVYSYVQSKLKVPF